MRPSVSKEFFGLQILRAAAAVSVVLHHFLEESNSAVTSFSPAWLTTVSAAGVDVFFVISGFIMLYTSFPASGEPISPGKFILRRACRIYPLYISCYLLMLLIISAGYLKNHRFGVFESVLSLALLPGSHPLIIVAWTLVYEIYFYAIFAATLVFRSAVAAAIGTTLLIAIIWSGASLFGTGSLGAFLANPIALEFVLGLWMAVTFVQGAEGGKHWRVTPVWGLLGILLLVSAALYLPHPSINGLSGWPRVGGWGVPAALITAAFISVGAPKNIAQRQLVFLGDASYAVYLTHGFIVTGYAFLLKIALVSRFPQFVLVPLLVLFAVAVGISVHLTIEKPLNRVIRVWTRRELGPNRYAAYPLSDQVGTGISRRP